MSELELSLAVVGIVFPNADGSDRQAEARLCRPGDPVELRPEPTNEHDERAIAVFSDRGVQIGYLTAERAAYIGGKIRAGEEAVAIFQDLQETAAIVRARIGGGRPTLPGSGAPAMSAPRPPRPARQLQEFYPDPDGPMWGA